MGGFWTHAPISDRPKSMKTLGTFGFIALVTSTVGCASSPAAPFNTLPESSTQVTAFRLQNFEPPPQAPVSAQQPGAALIPGLPPEIQQMVQQGAQQAQQWMPWLPLPGAAAPTAAPPPQENVPRFHNFRILSQTQVIDEGLKEELAELLGDEDNFEPPKASCLYAEVGLAFMPPGGQSNDLLVSFSCNQVSARTFAWPHRNVGLTSKTTQKLSDVFQRLWPPGA